MKKRRANLAGAIRHIIKYLSIPLASIANTLTFMSG